MELPLYFPFPCMWFIGPDGNSDGHGSVPYSQLRQDNPRLVNFVRAFSEGIPMLSMKLPDTSQSRVSLLLSPELAFGSVPDFVGVDQGRPHTPRLCWAEKESHDILRIKKSQTPDRGCSFLVPLRASRGKDNRGLLASPFLNLLLALRLRAGRLSTVDLHGGCEKSAIASEDALLWKLTVLLLSSGVLHRLYEN